MTPEARIGIILSQARIADRTAGAIPGAKSLAEALAEKFALNITDCADQATENGGHRADNWDVALDEAGPVLRQLAQATRAALSCQGRAIVIANTCSASLATLPAAATSVSDLALIWIDAHADYNTPATTGSGYLGGMALAGASGLWQSGHGAGIAPARTLILGARDIDAPEAAHIAQHAVQVLPPDQLTVGAVQSWLGRRPVWIHIDWDVMEPGLIPAAYAVAQGVLPNQLQAILAGIPSDQIIGLELAEYELPSDPEAARAALALILDIVSPIVQRMLAS
ncbi:arginase family protein [Xinfangfangia sp. D13-10-4-6]|uniref:arginase family protein n=1 Tax=Pseudogemmobacter hezensis TaxID=2737662 RepID=UPI001553D5AB|nr:arginase family protein [Pseudogemmobacter hezensis]